MMGDMLNTIKYGMALTGLAAVVAGCSSPAPVVAKKPELSYTLQEISSVVRESMYEFTQRCNSLGSEPRDGPYGNIYFDTLTGPVRKGRVELYQILSYTVNYGLDVNVLDTKDMRGWGGSQFVPCRTKAPSNYLVHKDTGFPETTRVTFASFPFEVKIDEKIKDNNDVMEQVLGQNSKVATLLCNPSEYNALLKAYTTHNKPPVDSVEMEKKVIEKISPKLREDVGCDFDIRFHYPPEGEWDKS